MRSTGAAPKSGSLLPSMTTLSLIEGRALARLMVCVPPIKAAPMLKWMRSAPPVPLALLLAAVMASRRLIKPSVPWLLSRAYRLLVSPSLLSVVVETTTVLCVSLSVFTTATSAGFNPL